MFLKLYEDDSEDPEDDSKDPEVVPKNPKDDSEDPEVVPEVSTRFYF